jgi:hypothetical protein
VLEYFKFFLLWLISVYIQYRCCQHAWCVRGNINWTTRDSCAKIHQLQRMSNCHTIMLNCLWRNMTIVPIRIWRISLIFHARKYRCIGRVECRPCSNFGARSWVADTRLRCKEITSMAPILLSSTLKPLFHSLQKSTRSECFQILWLDEGSRSELASHGFCDECRKRDLTRPTKRN